MGESFQLNSKRYTGLADQRQNFSGGLNGSLAPSLLLTAEIRQKYRQFGRYHDVVYVNEAPAGQLGPVADIQILGDRIRLPSAGLFNGCLAPDTGGAVEIEKQGTAPADLMFHAEVRRQEHGLDTGQPGVPGI